MACYVSPPLYPSNGYRYARLTADTRQELIHACTHWLAGFEFDAATALKPGYARLTRRQRARTLDHGAVLVGPSVIAAKIRVLTLRHSLHVPRTRHAPRDPRRDGRCLMEFER